MALRSLLVDTGPLRVSPQFHRLWIGRALSGFGTQMTAVAVLFQVWQVVSRSTVVQIHTPDDLRGRVGAAEQITGLAGPGLGNLRAGLERGRTARPASAVLPNRDDRSPSARIASWRSC